MESTYFNAACRRNGEVGPIPSITRKLSAVKKPMPWISSASQYGFRGQAPRRQGHIPRARAVHLLCPDRYGAPNESTLAIEATAANES